MSFDPVAWINTPRWQASRLGLDRMVDLLERLGRPQDDLRFVHVAGTNGKGSVCAYLAAMLEAAGYRVGLFTSPFILCFEERIRVNGVNITGEELLRAVEAVRPAAEAMEAETGDHPTEFELMAAVAFEHFRASACDIVVLEVGLGGRLDATNVIDRPEVSVITRIGLDHTDLLGNTLAAIAGEKAGIVKPGIPVVSWPQEPEAMAVIEAVCAERGCPLTVPDFAALTVEPLQGGMLRRFSYDENADGHEGRRDGHRRGELPLALGRDEAADAEWRDAHCRGELALALGRDAEAADAKRRGCCAPGRVGARPYETRLLGSYQPANAALALETVRVLRERGWAIPEEAQRAGIAEARWPGRFEVAAASPLTIIDGGHNPQGARALADSLADLLGEEGRGTVVFAMGVLADKDYPAMVQAVAPWARAFVAYTPANPRALEAEALAAHIEEACGLPAAVAPTPAAALAQARAAAGPDGTVVAFGTLYAIADLQAGLPA